MTFWTPRGTSSRCRVAAKDRTKSTAMTIHVYSTWSDTPGTVRIGGCSMAPTVLLSPEGGFAPIPEPPFRRYSEPQDVAGLGPRRPR